MVADRRRGIAVLHERAPQHQDPVGPRVPDEEAALGQRAVVAGRNEEELAAGAAVGSGEAEVDDPLEPHVVEGAESAIGGVSTTIGPSFRSTNMR